MNAKTSNFRLSIILSKIYNIYSAKIDIYLNQI